jgi:pimeloyl-ACP methyl ester carboxylesterase
VLVRYRVVKALVVAHSHGAGVALRLAAMAPDHVSALYLLDSGGLPVNRGPTLSAFLRLVPIVTRLPGGRTFVRERFLRGIRQNAGRQEWLGSETERAYSEPLLASIQRVVDMAIRLSKAEEPEPLSRVVACINVPVTAILGAARHPADAGPEEIIALAPLGARLRIDRLAGVGHFPREEVPNELLSSLLSSHV